MTDIDKELERIAAAPTTDTLNIPKPDKQPEATTKKRGRPKGSTNKPKVNQVLKKNLEQVFMLVGTSIYAFDQVCGGAIISQTEPLAQSLYELAESNPAVARVLLQLMQAGQYGAVLMAVFPIVIAVLSHHGKMPAALSNMMPQLQVAEPPEPTNNGEGTLDTDSILSQGGFPNLG
jgi:hypothetical protein